MPKGSPAPWFRKSRNSWFVTFGGRQVNLDTADRKEAIKRWHMLASQESAVAESAPQLSVRELIAEFLEWAEKNTRSYEYYAHYLTRFARTVPPELSAPDLRPFRVTNWLDTQKRWGANSRRCAIACVKRVYHWGVGEGCLRHWGGTGDSKVTLGFIDGSDQVREQTVSLPSAPTGTAFSGFLTNRADRAHFQERCYLSQARLARLLELYQAVDPERKESPLATFVRELLGLEVSAFRRKPVRQRTSRNRVRRNSRKQAVVAQYERRSFAGMPNTSMRALSSRIAPFEFEKRIQPPIVWIARSISELSPAVPNAPQAVGGKLKQHRPCFRAQFGELCGKDLAIVTNCFRTLDDRDLTKQSKPKAYRSAGRKYE